MKRNTYQKFTGKLVTFIIIFTLFLTGKALSALINTTCSIMDHGIREAIIAGIIIALLVALYSFILSKKGDNAGGRGYGACSCGRIFKDKPTIHRKRKDREAMENTASGIIPILPDKSGG